MPNPGGPFLGCETCRRRKIKCDKAKPECMRCQKYNKPCPGYPRLQDASFRNETKRVVQKKWGYSEGYIQPKLIAKAKPAALTLSFNRQYQKGDSAKELQCSHFELFENSKLLWPLHKPKVTIWDDVVCELFFAQNFMPVGWYAFLPQLYYESMPKMGVRQAVLAASYFLAANQLKDAGMLSLAQLKYGLALRQISSALADERALEDELLASILILNIVDDIVGQSNASLHAHLNGCAELVRLRARTPVRSQRLVDLVHSVIIQMQPSLIQALPLAATTLNDESIQEWLWQEARPPPSVKVSTLIATIGQLSMQSNDFISSSGWKNLEHGAVNSLLENGMMLEKQMLEWREDQKARWEVRTAAATGMEPDLHYYSDVQVAKIWNHWRVARIVLHGALLEIAEHLPSEQARVPLVQAESLEIVQQMLSEICASIPYHIHQIDEKGRRSSQTEQRVLGGRALMWPLKMLLTCRWSSASQRKEAVEALRLISNDFGVKQAAVFLQEGLAAEPCQNQL